MTVSFLKEIITKKEDEEISESFGNFLRGVHKVKTLKESLDDSSLVDELVEFIENDKNLTEQISDVKQNLLKHWNKSSYNSNLAERAWLKLVSEAAQKYSEEIGKEPRLWEDMFPLNIRKPLAEEFEKQFLKSLKDGTLDTEELFDECEK